jgi:hypothetical protein
MRAAKSTEDAAAGMLAISALICGFAIFGLYMREQIKPTSTAVSSIRLAPAKNITHKPVKAIYGTPSTDYRQSRAAAPEIITHPIAEDVKREAPKKAAWRRPATQRAYPGYAVPY